MQGRRSLSEYQRWKRRKSRYFNHPEDVHLAAFNVLVWACYLCAFGLFLEEDAAGIVGPRSRAAFVLGAGLLLGWISAINLGSGFHHHVHRPIFRSERWNRWFSRSWSLSAGWPAFAWRHAHLGVHHGGSLDREDWTIPRRRADGRMENALWYCLTNWPRRSILHLLRDGFQGRIDGGRLANMGELSIFLALWCVPFLIDPWMGLGLWLFPQWVANSLVLGGQICAHYAGTVPRSKERPVSHLNSFTSAFYNRTTFNSGYQILHHDYEQMHWSALPDFHRRMRSRLVEHGAHVLPYGVHHAADLICSLSGGKAMLREFTRSQADYYGTPATLLPLANLTLDALEPRAVVPPEMRRAG